MTSQEIMRLIAKIQLKGTIPGTHNARQKHGLRKQAAVNALAVEAGRGSISFDGSAVVPLQRSGIPTFSTRSIFLNHDTKVGSAGSAPVCSRLLAA